jgi:hypothetical protein
MPRKINQSEVWNLVTEAWSCLLTADPARGRLAVGVTDIRGSDAIL